MDWDVRTPWEKKIKVDYPMKNHRRWSNWSDKERDIYARVVYMKCEIDEEHGSRSKKAEEHVKYFEDVYIGFGRDHKAMPHWAINEHEEATGYGDDVEVVWHQPDIAGLGKWVAKQKEDAEVVDPDIEAANRYRQSVGLPPVEKSQSDKLRDALVEVNLRPDVVVKEFNPQTQRLEEIEGKPTTNVRASAQKIMPNDPNFTPMEKALNWAAETQHGVAHCNRWNEVAAAFGADTGYTPMTAGEIEKWWKHHNCNARWTMAMNAIEDITKSDVNQRAAAVQKEQEQPAPVEKSVPESSPAEDMVNNMDESDLLSLFQMLKRKFGL